MLEDLKDTITSEGIKTRAYVAFAFVFLLAVFVAALLWRLHG